MYVLSLGANVELELERCSPDPLDSAPVGADEGTEEKKTGGRKRRKSKKDTDPGFGLEPNIDPEGKGKGKEKVAVPKLPREKLKQKPKPVAPPHEKLKISMVHGDVLILSGGNYIVWHLVSWRKCDFNADPPDFAVYPYADRNVNL